MERRIAEIFPGFERPETAYFWRGLVCMTRKSAPSLGLLEGDPSVFYSYGYHASGVATAPWSGRLLARLIAGVADPVKDIPAVYSGQAPAIPFPSLRPHYLRAALSWYQIRDAMI